MGTRSERRMTIDGEPMRDGELAASQYDAMGTAYRAANDEGSFNACYERPGTIALIGDVTGQQVLEAGCGPGALTTWLVDSGARVTAIDVSPGMVRLATDRLGDRARILNADLAEPLDFAADASADLVVVTETWHKGGQPYEVTFWRRRLTAITAAISSAGFLIDRLVEPAPLPSLRQRDPEAYDKLRTRPGFLFCRLVKRSAGRS
jgi:SAM-dependent methyltransferase